jgi:hypothetical protein
MVCVYSERRITKPILLVPGSTRSTECLAPARSHYVLNASTESSASNSKHRPIIVDMCIRGTPLRLLYGWLHTNSLLISVVHSIVSIRKESWRSVFSMFAHLLPSPEIIVSLYVSRRLHVTVRTSAKLQLLLPIVSIEFIIL